MRGVIRSTLTLLYLHFAALNLQLQPPYWCSVKTKSNHHHTLMQRLFVLVDTVIFLVLVDTGWNNLCNRSVSIYFDTPFQCHGTWWNHTFLFIETGCADRSKFFGHCNALGETNSIVRVRGRFGGKGRTCEWSFLVLCRSCISFKSNHKGSCPHSSVKWPVAANC